MTVLFRTILAMSITASYCIFAVLLVRFFLRKAPRIYSYILWSVVLFRLICPFSFESRWSILNIPHYFLQQMENASPSEASSFIETENSFVSDTTSSITFDDSEINAPQKHELNVEKILSFIWLIGAISLLIYGLSRYFLSSYRLSNAILLEKNIYETDRIMSPFILGIRKPKIYLPLNLSLEEKQCVLLHETVHIRRKDYFVKFFAYLILCIYWFHPFVWLSMIFMNKDMEISCDEAVLAMAKEDIRKNYSETLLHLSLKQSEIFTPVSFGEENVRERILHILDYKKMHYSIHIFCTAIIICVISICAGNVKLRSSSFLDKIASNASASVPLRKNLLSLDDVTDEMILNGGILSISFINLQNYTSNGLEKRFYLFTGIENVYWLKTKTELEVQITYLPEIEENYKLVLIYPDDQIITLSKGTSAYLLPEGKIKIAIVGVHSKGNFQLSISPQENLEVKTHPFF